MNRILFHLFAVGVCVAVGHALQCYECKIGFWNLCITKKIMCDKGEHCFTGKGFAAGFVDVTIKGCLAELECNSTKDVNFPSSSNTTIYKMTKTCCNSNLCNAAPEKSGGPLFLATVAALLVANMLV
ncbi:sperm acrosome membrane-associated protein 4 [Phycodurus eques]|uniref:sperm acrosome membrane-associated protein 4 n=1 Tax=Phycodurus eques TaxID=693459 RepID=UPI002ACDB5C2|nr:sperm acrosome membrane-associated protein 4 [Phycodurus eques]